MNAELRHALGSLCVDAPDGLYASPKTARQLADVLAVLKSHGAVLGRDVKLSRGAFDRLEGVEPRSCTALAGAGIVLSELERAVGAHSMTLGPLTPAALKLTLGEYLEGTYGGLRSVSAGRLEPLCLSLEAVLPDGRVLRTHDSPRSAAGPELMALILGTHGRLGLTVSARVRCFPAIETRRTVRMSYPSVDAAVSALKAALADGCMLGAVRAQRIGSRPVLELELSGGLDAVDRDTASVQRNAPAMGGRAAGEAPAAVTSDVEGEASWKEIARALEGAAPLELYRLSLASAIVRGVPVAAPPAQWQGSHNLLKAFDPASVMGGAS
jgi:FAD/FMN-containing dehydrogenase